MHAVEVGSVRQAWMDISVGAIPFLSVALAWHVDDVISPKQLSISSMSWAFVVVAVESVVTLDFRVSTSV